MLTKHLFLIRFALINFVGLSLVAATYLQGWLAPFLRSHLYELLIGIAMVFLYGLGIAGWRIWQTTAELDALAAGTPNPDSEAGWFLAITKTADPNSHAELSGASHLRLTSRIVIAGQIANVLVFLGRVSWIRGKCQFSRLAQPRISGTRKP